MTKIISMVSRNNYKLSANDGFVILLTYKLITCSIDGYTSNESEHIYWILDFQYELQCTQYGLYGKTTFKNARAILFFEVRRSG